jgi:microcystin-dependent protein
MDPFVAEIRIFGFNFAPKGWAFCDGQLLPISQNAALFSLLGTTYGGDGKSNFALPDLQGRAPMHPNPMVNDPPNPPHLAAPGLSPHELGEQGGTETVTLPLTQIPAHNHAAVVSGRTATARTPNNQLPAVGSGVQLYGAFPGTPTNLAFQALIPAGSSAPHNNMMPYVTMNFCIAMQGVFPPRT